MKEIHSAINPRAFSDIQWGTGLVDWTVEESRFIYWKSRKII